MTKQKIRIKNGRHIITQMADVETYLDKDGRETALAFVGRKVYRVVDRDFDGPIWGRC